jgi:hypothetical protein
LLLQDWIEVHGCPPNRISNRSSKEYASFHFASLSTADRETACAIQPRYGGVPSNPFGNNNDFVLFRAPENHGPISHAKDIRVPPIRAKI